MPFSRGPPTKVPCSDSQCGAPVHVVQVCRVILLVCTTFDLSLRLVTGGSPGLSWRAAIFMSPHAPCRPQRASPWKCTASKHWQCCSRHTSSNSLPPPGMARTVAARFFTQVFAGRRFAQAAAGLLGSSKLLARLAARVCKPYSATAAASAAWWQAASHWQPRACSAKLGRHAEVAVLSRGHTARELRGFSGSGSPIKRPRPPASELWPTGSFATASRLRLSKLEPAS